MSSSAAIPGVTGGSARRPHRGGIEFVGSDPWAQRLENYSMKAALA
jgi:hypothetical protein